jgi:three-Cys-motif partner protein
LQVHHNFSDELTVTASEPWFKVKVQVIVRYLEAFVGQVAGRADEIIFVDLFSGSGLYTIGHQKEIFPASCFQALLSGLPITRYIFCEQDPEQLQALKTRVHKFFPRHPVTIFEHPIETLPARFPEIVPQGKPHRKAAVFCLIDPCSLDVPFSTIEKFGRAGWNLLMPFVFPLNVRMNHAFYQTEYRDKLQRYVGVSGANKLSTAENNGLFYQNLVRIYENNMLVMGMNSAISINKLKSQWMELAAYNIGFFSAQISAKAVQQEVQGNEFPQFELF